SRIVASWRESKNWGMSNRACLPSPWPSPARGEGVLEALQMNSRAVLCCPDDGLRLADAGHVLETPDLRIPREKCNVSAVKPRPEAGINSSTGGANHETSLTSLDGLRGNRRRLFCRRRRSAQIDRPRDGTRSEGIGPEGAGEERSRAA